MLVYIYNSPAEKARQTTKTVSESGFMVTAVGSAETQHTNDTVKHKGSLRGD